MRSSKSRSRNKSNRNRSVGNITNRVFDSSGPEGKVRGTPAQIIEKYNQLARDAQLSNDRVAAENFQQHAEHYTRLLSDAQRQMEARREQQEAQQRERQRERDQERAARQQQQQPQDRPGEQIQLGEEPQTIPEIGADPSLAPQPDIMDIPPVTADSGLVDTPESRPKRAPRKPRKRTKPADQTAAKAAGDSDEQNQGPRDKATNKQPPVDHPDAPEAAE